MTKEIKEKTPKAPRVIRVKTVVISVLVVLAMVGSFVGGIIFETHDQNRIQTEAKNIVSSLK